VAAVALLIDYVVTVAVQTAADSAAIVSAFPALSHLPVIGPRIPAGYLGRRDRADVPRQPARAPRGGIYTALVVLLFAVVKFTEGAWLIVIVFPVLVFILIRLNREYQAEAACLADAGHGGPRAQPPNYSRRVVLLLVDGYDPATIAALKYARGLRPTVLRAVHFSLDSARADQLCRQWVDAGTGIPLELADCPDRRLAHAAARLATSLATAPGTHVTVVLPRRCYPPLAGRLLHDHTADRIARVVSRVPDAAATIVPLVFLGRAHIAGLGPGRRIRLHGKVGLSADGQPTMTNPAYELLA
jgi:hypothetical protein